jgi:tetratricopeptide (TPR) repeat protein
MEDKTTPRFGLFTVVYMIAGVFIFAAIGYTYTTRQPAFVPAALPVNTPSTAEAVLPDSVRAASYMSQSVEFYSKKQYHECIRCDRKALELNPKLSQAYNNICSAYNNLGEWDSAIQACNKAIELSPDFNLAKANLKYSQYMKNGGKN